MERGYGTTCTALNNLRFSLCSSSWTFRVAKPAPMSVRSTLSWRGMGIFELFASQSKFLYAFKASSYMTN